MFSNIKRKLASIVRKKTGTPLPSVLQVRNQEFTGYRISSSRFSDQHLACVERSYSPRPHTAANRTYGAVGFGEEVGSISILDLGEAYYQSQFISLSATSSTTPLSDTSRQQPESPALLEAEIIGSVIVQHQERHHHALLLTADMYGSIQDFARIRRELHELNLDISGLTEQANNLHVAKETLESRAENTIPGALSKPGDEGETARRQLLMPAIRRRLGICERSLHDLNERRHVMAAELKIPQQRILGAFGDVSGTAG